MSRQAITMILTMYPVHIDEIMVRGRCVYSSVQEQDLGKAPITSGTKNTQDMFKEKETELYYF